MDASGRDARAPVTVAVCSRDGDPDDLDAVLDAVTAQVRGDDDVVLVDSASRTDRVAAAAARHDVRLLHLDRRGVSRARNLVLHHATTDAVLFTDDDCCPEPGWVDALSGGLEPGVAAVCGQVRPQDEPGVAMSVLLADEPYEIALAQLDRAGHAANLALERTAALAVGGFDPVLGAGAPLGGAEDKDVMARLLAAGHRVAYRPEASVTHRPRPTRRGALAASRAYGTGAGACHRKLQRLGIDGQPPVPAALRRAAAAARDGYRFGVLLEAAFVVGALDGQWRARGLDVRDGRFARGTP